MQALEALALKESNSQVRRMAAWALAAAAVAARAAPRAQQGALFPTSENQARPSATA